jgi:RNA polymerase sigma factor (sigma-70 family)
VQDQQEFRFLMQRVQAGCPEAAQQLLERYGHHIVRVVRRRLHRKLRSKFDSEDFVQAVWASFFALDLSRYQFDSPEALIGFLANLARNKVVEEVRLRLHTLKHDITREHSLYESSGHAAGEVPARQPTPSEIAVAREQWDRLLEDQPEHHQRILDLLRQGHTPGEVAQQLGLSVKTVRRLICKLATQGRSHDPARQVRSRRAARRGSAAGSGDGPARRRPLGA